MTTNQFIFDKIEHSMEEMLSTDMVIKAQFILDGADTLNGAADMARAYADFLDRLAEEGYVLASTIEDDLGYAILG
jgi:hypothetical protein